jgi:hypothetical protein
MYKKAIGRFSKGVKGSVSLNFCLAGGKYCDKSCNNHPASGGSCYAIRPQKMYPTMAKSLSSKEGVDPGDIVEQAIDEVKRKKSIPWFRFSVAGSLPHQKDSTPKFEGKLIELVDILRERGVPTHLPVECPSKVGFYNGMLENKVTVRLSIQHPADFLSYLGPCSLVVGGEFTRHKRGNSIMSQRIAASKSAAKARRQLTGRAVMVCPAIKGLRATNKSKCGKCKACAMANIDVVYPLH